MEEEKADVNKEEYEKVTPRIGYYMKNKNIQSMSNIRSRSERDNQFIQKLPGAHGLLLWT